MLAAIAGGAITYGAWQNAVNEEYQRKLEAEMRLRESESRFEQLVEAAPDPIFITSGGEFAYINPAATRLFGASDASLLMGQPTDQLVPSDAEEQEDAATHSEQTYWRLDNTEVPVDVSSVAIEFHGRPSKLIFAQDITERRQAREEIIALNQSLTERVRQRTLALESANRELEAFVYSASHDLRAPLRALDGFAGILAEEYHAKLDQEGQRLVRIIRASAEDMDRLIGDLLRLSRTSRAEMRHERIDMTVLVQRAWEATASTEVRSAFSLELAALPAASGDPVLIRQVWLNLLDNAVKYTMPKPVRCIWIGSWQEPGEIVYYVRDSGVGFDPRHVGKLFGVFQRLHSTSEFAGNGIGLALVQRIVARHGGRVWAEGQPDQGATFYFTLPEGVERTDETAGGQTGGNNAGRGQSA
jgi:PAS domain S-box-containing protein